MHAIDHPFTARFDVTSKAKHHGLCPNDDACSVHMEQALFNEIIMLSTAGSVEGLSFMNWLYLIDVFMDTARKKLETVPLGAYAFDCDVDLHHDPKKSVPTSVPIHVELEDNLSKRVMVFSLSKEYRSIAA